MLDWEGHLVEAGKRQKYLLSEIEDNNDMEISCTVSSAENVLIDHLIELRLREPDDDKAPGVDRNAYNIDSIGLDDKHLYDRMRERRELGCMKASLGSMDAPDDQYLFHDTDLTDTDTKTNVDAMDMNLEECTELLGNPSIIQQIVDHTLEGDGTTALEMEIDDLFVASTTATPSRGVDAKHLAKIWRIDLETAEKTIELTTQRVKRSEGDRLSRNYGTSDRMLRYKRLDKYFFMDTFFATKNKGKSSRGHVCCQLFVTDKGFVYVVPMKSKSEVLQAVKQFAKEVGAPDAIISDAAREQKSTDLKKFCQSVGTSLRILEEGTPWSNKAELYIGIMKESVRKDMKDSGAPLPFWDYCVERRARVHNMTASNLFQVHGANPHTAVLSEQGDISNLCQFGFYEWCHYRDDLPFPNDKERLGRCLGPARGEGNEMAQWILTSKATVVPRRSPRPLSVAELNSPNEEKIRAIFDAVIEKRYGNRFGMLETAKPSNNDGDDDNEWEPYSDSEEEKWEVPEIEDTVDSQGRPLNQQPAYDKVLNQEIHLQLEQGKPKQRGVVKRRAAGPDMMERGRYDENPILNSMIYEVECDDGTLKEYAANVIAEHMWNSVDDDGYSSTMFDAIVDFKKDNTAVAKNHKYFNTRTGQKRRRITTRGWKLLIRWTDGSEVWIPLKDMKNSHPVETAEFA